MGDRQTHLPSPVEPRVKRLHARQRELQEPSTCCTIPLGRVLPIGTVPAVSWYAGNPIQEETTIIEPVAPFACDADSIARPTVAHGISTER